ncbi:MAG: hypothetical protein ACOZHQ_01335 [Thermodesulfobacteriota bacterium]
MKWMEIIALRSLVKTNRHLVDELLRQLLEQKRSGLAASIRVYHHPTVDTDLSIHIYWEAEQLNPSGSPLGQQLAYALKGLGLLSYSVWLEATVFE